MTYDPNEDLRERIAMLDAQNVATVLSRKHGLPGVSKVALGLEPIGSGLDGLSTRFDREYWFAKPPPGTPWPSRYMHHTFETCWLSRHDAKIGDVLHTQIACMPHHAQMLMIWQTCGTAWWIENNGITVFPEDHLVEACSKTDVLDCVTGSDLHPAYPFMLFGVSDKCRIENDTGSDWINYIGVSFLDNGEEEQVKVGTGTLTVRMPRDCPRYIIINAFWKSGFVSSFSIPLREHVSLGKLIDEFSNDFIDDEFRESTLTKDQLDAEHAETSRVGKTVASMVFNLCLLMQSYPEYVTRQSEKHDRRLRLRTKPPPATYRINDRTAPVKPPPVYEGPQSQKSDDESDQQRTVSPHWRRGHWKRQPHSAEWEVANPGVTVVLFPDGRHAHMTWIRPVFVSGRRGATT